MTVIEQDAFAKRLAQDGHELRRDELRTLQLNLGKQCNLACHHCHVEAGPARSELMSWATMARILAWLDRHRAELAIETADLTGGAPEMNGHFRKLVDAFVDRGVHVLDRCNLTILLEPGYEDLIDFLAARNVQIVASLPCYLQQNVDRQRGAGVFDGSIAALKKLNAAGYGLCAALRLDLVFNPVGDELPPPQDQLEEAYKRRLREDHGIRFDRLWTLTNMPIKRFAHALERDGKLEVYLERLAAAHNGANLDQVMCRTLISVGWEGAVYDCDFNQMLHMPLSPSNLGPHSDEHFVEHASRKLWHYHPAELIGRAIRTGLHCFGCTAGAGSSCTGALRQPATSD